MTPPSPAPRLPHPRRRRFLAALPAVFLCAPHALAARAPVVLVFDIDTAGAREAFASLAQAVDRRFAHGLVRPAMQFVAMDALPTPGNEAAIRDHLSRIRPDVICASNAGFAKMLVSIRPDKPVLFFSLSDPIAEGLTDSLTEPNRGMTGFTLGLSATVKRQEMLGRLVPRARLVGQLSSRLFPGEGLGRPRGSLPFRIRRFDCESLDDLDAMLRRPDARGVDAWDVEYTYLTFRHPEETVGRLSATGKPAMYPRMKHIHLGGMAAYEPRIDEADDAWVSQLASLLAGVPVNRIPVFQATRYSFGLNLPACRRASVVPAKSLIRIADVVLE